MSAKIKAPLCKVLTQQIHPVTPQVAPTLRLGTSDYEYWVMELAQCAAVYQCSVSHQKTPETKDNSESDFHSLIPAGTDLSRMLFSKNISV